MIVAAKTLVAISATVTVAGAAILAAAADGSIIPYAELTGVGAVCIVLVWLITKTLPASTAAQQLTIDALLKQESALSKAVEGLKEVVRELSQKQADTAQLVATNQKVVELLSEQQRTTQQVVLEIMRTLKSANEMMEPVPKLREESNRLLREMLEAMKAKP